MVRETVTGLTPARSATSDSVARVFLIKPTPVEALPWFSCLLIELSSPLDSRLVEPT